MLAETVKMLGAGEGQPEETVLKSPGKPSILEEGDTGWLCLPRPDNRRDGYYGNVEQIRKENRQKRINRII